MVAACGSDPSTTGSNAPATTTTAGSAATAAGAYAAKAGSTAAGAAGAQTSASGGSKAPAAGTTASGAAGVTPAAGGGASGAGAAGVAAGSGGTSAAAGSAAGSGGAAGDAAGASSAAGSAAMGGGMLGGALMYTSAFTMGTTIPTVNKCPMPLGGGTGDNKSPVLSWKGGPAETKSFAIVLYDTRYNMLHWVLWDIPATVNELPEGLPSGYELSNPAGAHQAANMGSDPHAYYGPCSTGAVAGMYEYRLYALNTAKLTLTESSTGPEAQSAVEAAKLEMVVWSGKPM